MKLLFDIGGTNTRLALTRDGKIFEKPKILQTPQGFAEAVEKLGVAAREIMGKEKIEFAVGGVPGPLNAQKSRLVHAPHLQHWIGEPLKEGLESVFGAPVSLENDTALCGLGEALYGAGKGVGIVAYVTISTGAGGVRIVNGTIDSNAYGFEIGHHIIDYNGNVCHGCSGRGHWEGYVSGTALQQKYNNIPSEIRDEHVWEEEAKFIAYGLNNVIVFWSPHMIVLGGSVIRRGYVAFERIGAYLKDILNIFPEAPSIVKGELGDEAGLYGALHLSQTIRP